MEAVRGNVPRSAAAGAGASRTGERSVALALARAEGKRLLRHPLVALGAAVAPVLVFLLTRRGVPVLHRDDGLVALTLLPLAAATFLAANLAALRAGRSGTDELFESMPAPASSRTLAHVLSTGWPAALGLALTGMAVAYMQALRAVGTPSLAELVTGPAVVAVCGTAGVALARWVPYTVAGPVGLVALGAAQASLSLGLGFVASSLTSDPASRIRWLAVWAPLAPYNVGDPARELVIRPAGWHLAYVLGLLAAVATLALLRHGARAGVASVATVGLALILVAGEMQLRHPTEGEREALVALVRDPRRFQVCEMRDGIRLCAFPGYEPWIDRWAEPVSSVLRLVPPHARPLVLVRQRLEVGYGSDLPEAFVDHLVIQQDGKDIAGGEIALATGTHWPRGEEEGEQHLALALGTAAWAVGLPPTQAALAFSPRELELAVDLAPPGQREGVQRLIRRGDWYGCAPAGQARAVVALWLAARASPATEEAFRTNYLLNPFGRAGADPGLWFETAAIYQVTGHPVIWETAEAAFALQLLDLPTAAVVAVVEDNWDILVRPSTTTDEVIRVFDLEPVPTLEELVLEASGDESMLRRYRRWRSFVYRGLIPCP